MIPTVTTKTTTTVTTAHVRTYSIIAVVSLVVFLALKEMLSSQTDRPSIKLFGKDQTLQSCPYYSFS